MQLFVEILTGITLPILGLVALGYGVQRRLAFDIDTLTRMQVYVLVPGALIYFPYAATVPLDTAWPVFWFTALHFTFTFVMGWAIPALMGMNRNICGIIAFATAFSNSGNYGIPLIQLTFPEDFVFYQTVVLSMHSLVIAPLAMLVFSTAEMNGRSLWRALFSTPMLPAVALGFLLKGFEVTLPTLLELPLKLISQAFTPMALILLGVQLAAINGRIERAPLVLTMVLRMIMAPASAWLFAWGLGFSPELTAFFVVGSAVPVAVLLAIFASEYRAHRGLASMIVFLSTLLSALAVTGWVYAVRIAGLY